MGVTRNLLGYVYSEACTSFDHGLISTYFEARNDLFSRAEAMQTFHKLILVIFGVLLVLAYEVDENILPQRAKIRDIHFLVVGIIAVLLIICFVLIKYIACESKISTLHDANLNLRRFVKGRCFEDERYLNVLSQADIGKTHLLLHTSNKESFNWTIAIGLVLIVAALISFFHQRKLGGTSHVVTNHVTETHDLLLPTGERSDNPIIKPKEVKRVTLEIPKLPLEEEPSEDYDVEAHITTKKMGRK
eukprot:TRINITY_DN14588_c0_g1_i1.p1 TRINITY_DN14588_c0_g1~~TRINITY_DN14588_c0_g1_i1.p1  ORF type:complete len:246 (-),score=21.78 TRINITY_DN14588_c0_g1_i1:203-940(-)